MASRIMKFLQAEQYSKIESSPTESDSQEEKLLPFSETVQRPGRCSHRAWNLTWSVTAVVGSSILLSSVLSFIAGAILFRATDASCTRRLSSFSPMFSAVEYREINLANEFQKQTIYRGVPTPEGDAAWSKLWNHPSFNIPEAQLIALNYSAEIPWKHTPPEYGGGVEVQAEVYHQLHCLNLIRQYTYLDHYEIPPKGFDGSSKLSRDHVDHCIETLRLQVMCAGDVTVIPVKLAPEIALGARAVFSTRHVCRNFHKLLSWTEAHATPS